MATPNHRAGEHWTNLKTGETSTEAPDEPFSNACAGKHNADKVWNTTSVRNRTAGETANGVGFPQERSGAFVDGAQLFDHGAFHISLAEAVAADACSERPSCRRQHRRQDK